MKLITKEPDASVNVSKVSPVVKVFQILGGLCVALVVVYVALGLLVNVLAPYVPDTLERKLGEMVISSWPVTDSDEIGTYEAVVEKLVGPEQAAQYEIRMIESTEFNAVAIPGNIIAVFTGLAEEAQNEEVIAFVLGHEMGHFKNRDHIKRYGRVMVLSVIANLMTGSNSDLTNLAVEVMSKTEMKFSQTDELKADAYGAELLYEAYGSYDGAIELFEMVNELQNRGKLESYFDTHPHPENRIKAINALSMNDE